MPAGGDKGAADYASLRKLWVLWGRNSIDSIRGAIVLDKSAEY